MTTFITHSHHQGITGVENVDHDLIDKKRVDYISPQLGKHTTIPPTRPEE